jgi:hypothetical protein
MRMFNLLSLPIAIFMVTFAAFAAEMPSPESGLCYALSQASTARYLSNRDLARLAETCHGTRAAVADERKRRDLNIVSVNCSRHAWRFDIYEEFQTHVLEQIQQAILANPCHWIRLNLAENNLGKDSKFLHTLLVEVARTLRRLGVGIEALDLSENQLTELPDSIGDLRKLQHLWLSSNRLRTLPDSIGNLVNLQELSLYNNELTCWPGSIGNLVNLQYLWLNSNQLTTLPDSIGNLVNLQQLYLSNNKLTGLPDSIGNLRNLQKLYLSDNKLTVLPYSIGNLVKLQDLSLGSNPIQQGTNAELHLPETVTVHWQ